jgi:HEAT repeat protein
MWQRAVFVLIVAVCAAPTPAADPAEQLDDELSLMALKGAAYDPKGLHALGAAGLTGTLDRFFPETAPAQKSAPRNDEEVKRLIVQLGSEEFRAREEATETLIARGKNSRELLLAAADSDDAEVRLRARRILAAWEPKSGSLVETSLGGFWTYAEGIRDQERLELLARRVVAVLDRGWPDGSRLHLVRLCIAGVAKGGEENSCELLRPMVRHQDPRVAKLVTETVGSYRTDSGFFPPLLLDALASSRDELTQIAIRWSQNCQDPERQSRVRLALREIFDKRAEALKFQACLPLVSDYDDADAWLYLLEQTQSREPLRAASALSWISDSKHTGRRAPRELVEKLSPRLASPTLAVRWGAVKALGTHSGEEVVALLIPLLGDAQQSVCDEVRRCLLKQPNERSLRERLTAAAGEHSDAKVRARAKELLDKLAH